MARFVEILLVLFCLTKLNATNATCTNDQFQCKSNGKCIPIDRRCDGIFWGSNCEDGSDEDDCDYSSMVDEDQRIVCGQVRMRIWTPLRNSSVCLDYNCWWDDASSTCYKKYAAARGGLKCHNCYVDGLVDQTLKCSTGDHYESCDIVLASDPYSSNIHDQRCINGGWYTKCGTADECAGNKGASCCTTDYCNPLTIPAVTEPLTNVKKVEVMDAFVYGNNLASLGTRDKTNASHWCFCYDEPEIGSKMKLDLVAACIVAITSIMMTV